MCVCAVLLCLFLNLVIWESSLDDNFVFWSIFSAGGNTSRNFRFISRANENRTFYHNFVPICDGFDVVIQLFDLSVLNPYFYSHSFIRSKRLFSPTVAEIFQIYLAVTLLLARAIVILKKKSFFFLIFTKEEKEEYRV